MQSFDEIAIKYGSDKSSLIHNYSRIYEYYFEHIRSTPIKLLEIGIYDSRFPGASARIWKSYFKNVDVYGFDINPEATSLEKEGVTVFIGNQSNPNDLLTFIKQHGKDIQSIKSKYQGNTR